MLEINLVAPDQKLSQRAIEQENVFQALRLSYIHEDSCWMHKCHAGHEGIPLLEFWYKEILEEERRLTMYSPVSHWRGEWLRIPTLSELASVLGCSSSLALWSWKSCVKGWPFLPVSVDWKQGQHLRQGPVQKAALCRVPVPLSEQKQPWPSSWLSWRTWARIAHQLLCWAA